MAGFPQRNILIGNQVWTGDPVPDATASQNAFDTLTLLIQQLKNRTVWGVTDGSDAIAGQIGEFVESTSDENSVTGWSNGVVQNITSISLTAGDWDVEGVVQFGNGAITGTEILGAISLTSDAFDVTIGISSQGQTPPASVDLRMAIARRRISITSTTTVYLVGRIGFTAGTPKAGGYISARRIR